MISSQVIITDTDHRRHLRLHHAGMGLHRTSRLMFRLHHLRLRRIVGQDLVNMEEDRYTTGRLMCLHRLRPDRDPDPDHDLDHAQCRQGQDLDQDPDRMCRRHLRRVVK